MDFLPRSVDTIEKMPDFRSEPLWGVVFCIHLYIIIMCSAGPEAAVFDWYGPEADPGY